MGFCNSKEFSLLTMKQQYQTGVYILVLLTVLSITSGYSQQDPSLLEKHLKPKFGIKGGVNLANFSDTQYLTDKNLRIGYNFGVFANFPISRVFTIQPEILRSTKGSRLLYKGGELGNGEYNINLDYIEVPVNLTIRVDPIVNFHVGGYVSYLTSSSVKAVWQNDARNGIENLKRSDFKSLDYGFTGGLAVDIQHLTFGARYTQGLNAIGKSDSIVKSFKNSVVSVYVGFTI